MEDMGMMPMPMPMDNCSCNMSMGGMMPMQFYFGLLPGGLLFSGWTIKTVGELIGSIIAIIALAIIYEGLKSLRELLMDIDKKRKNKKGLTSVQDEKTPLLAKGKQSTRMVHRMASFVEEYVNPFHILQSVLHVIQVGLGYLLMLVAMTFNGWLFLAVCFGAGIGYFMFAACRRQTPSAQSFREQNEHCE